MVRLRWLAAAWALTASYLASTASLPPRNSSAYSLHEKRSLSAVSGPWRRSARVPPEAVIPLRIGLTQSNLHNGYDHLLALSHPESPRYGQYLSTQEVHQLFAPSDEYVTLARDWLVTTGAIDRSEIVHSENKGWLAVDVPASVAEQLLLTEIYEYEHQTTGRMRLGCDEYHLPDHLREHVDYVTPGVKLSAPLRRRSASDDKAHSRSLRSTPPPHGPWSYPPSAHTLPPELRHCGANISTACIRALYGLPIPTIADQSNSPGFYEQGDWYSQHDLNTFFSELTPWIPRGTKPVKQLIDGAIDPVPANSNLNGGEASIDLEVAFGLVYPTVPTVYQVDDTPDEKHEVRHNNLFNTFLDALDGSYCNYTAYGITGDSWQDPKFPDPKKHGYKGKLQCGIYTPTKVISISYGEAEFDIPERYDKRQCNEFMKLALQGHTVFEASGDWGVASFSGDDTPSGCLIGNEGQKVYNPDQLSSCPYVTSVGGTILWGDQTVLDEESALQISLSGRGNDKFASHGGFSNYFPRPAYQEEVVERWFQEHDPGYPTYVANEIATNIGEGGGIYNRAGRAFPDVSANGAFILGVIDQHIGHHYGTSFSSPIWASVITLINQERSLAGKGPVGFINPVLYANPWALNDIKNGSNPNCGTAGFDAVEGWDPVTGLGTPNYPKLLEVFMNLP